MPARIAMHRHNRFQNVQAIGLEQKRQRCATWQIA